MPRKGKYTFIKKKETPDVLLSILLSGVSLIILIVTVALAAAGIAQETYIPGVLGLMALLLSAYALRISFRILAGRRSAFRLPAVSTLFSGTMTILWIVIFLSGVR